MSQRPLQLLAAGSLRGAWPALMAAFEAKTGLKTQTAFGPAGLLRQQIEQGEPCDLFASANRHHTTALVIPLSDATGRQPSLPNGIGLRRGPLSRLAHAAARS